MSTHGKFVAKVIRVDDEKTDKALSEIRRTLEVLARDPWLNAAQFTGIALANATTMKIKHGLGRAYQEVFLSPPKGAAATGRVDLLEPTDPTKEVWLQANGYGATVTVNMRVL